MPRMGRCGALLFDFNGTLSHDEPLLLFDLPDLFARHGRPLTRTSTTVGSRAWRRRRSWGWLGVDGPLLGSLIAERVEAYATRGSRRLDVPDPIRDAVRHAATRVPVAIVSAAFRAEIVPVVEAAGLTRDHDDRRCRRRRARQAAPGALPPRPRPARPGSRRPRSRSRTPRPESRPRRPPDPLRRGSRHAARRRLGTADEIVDAIDVALVDRLLGRELSAVILAIDQGTTGTTCLVFDDELPAVGRGYREIRQHFPQPGLGRARPRGDLGERPRYRRGGARRRRHRGRRARRDRDHEPARDDRRLGAAHRRPLHHAIVWQDRRTADALRASCRPISSASAPGSSAIPYFSATKLEWILARTRAPQSELAFGTIDSLARLEAHRRARRTSPTSRTPRARCCSTSQPRAWDDELLELFGVDRARAAGDRRPRPASSPRRTLLGATRAGRRDRRRPAGGALRPGLPRTAARRRRPTGPARSCSSNVGDVAGAGADGLLTTAAASRPARRPSTRRGRRARRRRRAAVAARRARR